jgi:histone demethylase JARID1
MVTINGASSGNAGVGGTNPNSSRNSPALGVAASSSNAPASRMRAAAPNATNGSTPSAHAPPISSMKSAALDMSTVERRGQPTEVHEPVVKKTRPWDLEEAPTFWPTEEEWRDPGEYMRKISPRAQKYGICKIIPPESWDPDFAIDTEKFHFRTRKQELNSVEGKTRASLAYLDGLNKFHKQQGNNLHRMPYVDKKPLDLHKLKKCVETRGGFEKVCKHKKWAEIGRDLGYSGKIMSSLSTSLKNSYQKWLEPYEEYLKLAKPGVHQQLEYEYGGPLGTPSPSLTPMKRSGVYTPPTAGSPARHATDALQATLQGHTNGTKDSDRDTPMPDAPSAAAVASPAPAATPTPNAPSGFRAINSGGFTAVNSGFTSVNRTPKTDTPSHNPTSAVTTARNTPDMKPSTLGPASSLKRQHSIESLNSSTKDGEGDDADAGGRRSKRAKKGKIHHSLTMLAGTKVG